jgi:hypothetical protein
MDQLLNRTWVWLPVAIAIGIWFTFSAWRWTSQPYGSAIVRPVGWLLVIIAGLTESPPWVLAAFILFGAGALIDGVWRSHHARTSASGD